MCLQVRRVDRHLVNQLAPCLQCRKDPVGESDLRPSHYGAEHLEFRRIPLHQHLSVDVDDPGYHSSFINPRHAAVGSAAMDVGWQTGHQRARVGLPTSLTPEIWKFERPLRLQQYILSEA